MHHPGYSAGNFRFVPLAGWSSLVMIGSAMNIEPVIDVVVNGAVGSEKGA